MDWANRPLSQAPHECGAHLVIASGTDIGPDSSGCCCLFSPVVLGSWVATRSAPTARRRRASNDPMSC